jgi:general secretion pathway protein M
MSVASILARAGLWWTRRSVRERALLGLMAAALAGYVLIVAVGQPLLAGRAEARSSIVRFESMQAPLATLADDGPVAVAPSSDQPVATVVTDTAPGYGLTIRRIETDQGGTRLEIEDAGFAEIILWVEELERQHGLRLVALEMDRRPEPGIVSARLTVQR